VQSLLHARLSSITIYEEQHHYNLLRTKVSFKPFTNLKELSIPYYRLVIHQSQSRNILPRSLEILKVTESVIRGFNERWFDPLFEDADYHGRLLVVELQYRYNL